jgi:hypothetical protein
MARDHGESSELGHASVTSRLRRDYIECRVRGAQKPFPAASVTSTLHPLSDNLGA